MSVAVFTVVVAALVSTSGAVLPQFSWDTLPVFFHSANTSGPYSADAIHVIAKYPMVTIEKWQGYDMLTVDDEDEMVLAMKAIKQANPKVATYFYMSSFTALPEMTRTCRQLDGHQNWILHDMNGNAVQDRNGYHIFDLSNPEVRQWWIDTCLDALSASNRDGCFCDSSQRTFETFPYVPTAKMQAWSNGLLQLTEDAQQQLGNDRLLISKVSNQPYVKAVQIEFFKPNNESINNLTEGVKNGKVVQAHVPIFIDCRGDLTDYIAAFLIGAGKYCYFGCGRWNATGDDDYSWHWRPEYDYPLGEPAGPASYVNGVWKRKFSLGTEVRFDTSTNKRTVKWSIARLR